MGTTATTQHEAPLRSGRSHSGYTLMELVVVIAISGVLVTLALDTMGSARRVTSVRGAAETMMSLGARARAMAVGRGTMATLHIDLVGDSAWIAQNGQRVEVVRFGTEMKVDLRGYKNQISICMSPRGFADVDCNTYTGVRRLVFANKWHSREVTLFPLGQMFLGS